MRLYADFYNNFVKFDSGFNAMPQLILVCEDKNHMAECYVEIVKAKVEFKKLKLYFTTDLDQNSTSLKKSLYEFVKDEATGKVKTNNIELNILG